MPAGAPARPRLGAGAWACSLEASEPSVDAGAFGSSKRGSGRHGADRGVGEAVESDVLLVLGALAHAARAVLRARGQRGEAAVQEVVGPEQGVQGLVALIVVTHFLFRLSFRCRVKSNLLGSAAAQKRAARSPGALRVSLGRSGVLRGSRGARSGPIFTEESNSLATQARRGGAALALSVCWVRP